jgi:4-oxalomesaconate hydratase
MKDQNILIVSAHAADFVWRSGGTIAKYIKNGANLTLVILSYGARGESNDLWKEEGQTLENVKKIRLSEIEKAAQIIGVKNMEIWDFKDYPITLGEDRLDMLAKKIREVRPSIIVTHSFGDAFNPDHEKVAQYVRQASVMAVSKGIQYEGLENVSQMKIFGFEPHQTEISHFTPEVIIDITETFDLKKQAMDCFQAQPHLIQYYTDRARSRGDNARRASGNKSFQYAETFSRFYPYVGSEFV